MCHCIPSLSLDKTEGFLARNRALQTALKCVVISFGQFLGTPGRPSPGHCTWPESKEVAPKQLSSVHPHQCSVCISAVLAGPPGVFRRWSHPFPICCLFVSGT